MDEDISLSSAQAQQPQPSTSESEEKTTKRTTTTTTTEEEKQKEQKQQQPSTSKTCKVERPREFGYTEPIPFAPWRRKRYALTVQGLHDEIVDMYHWIKPNEIESRLRTKVFEKVRDSVLRRWTHKKVKISMFGSLRTNLFLPTSDIDVLVECEDWVGSSGDVSQQEWLAETARGLETDNIAESVMVYGGAFVPIVKMVDRDTRLSIDISFNTVQGVRAASYIAKVKEEFPLMEPLVLLLKQFLHYRNLNQTFTGGLSSYGLVLLLVNFFQLYAIDMRHRTIQDNGVNLGYLLLRFLELYSSEFNYEELGISPGQACYIPKAANGARYGHKRAQPGNLALEDPLLTANDVGRSTYNFSSIANAFGQALQILMVAVTLRERKGRNLLAMKGYKGSLLHMIIPFTAKELTYRNWLMSSVMSMPRKECAVSYDLNQLHNTLVSPTVDLSRYAWLRKNVAGFEKRDSRPLKIVNPTDDIKNQVIAQLKAKMEEERLKLEEQSASKPPATTATSTVVNDEDLLVSAPPLPTSTASVNTSATVSTAASISEREDTDSPGLSLSLGTPSSEDDEDGMVNRMKTSSGAVQFKKQFSEVVAQNSGQKGGKECSSRRTQTRFDDRKEDLDQKSFLNGLNPSSDYYRHYTDYASVVSSYNNGANHKYRNGQQYTQRPRHHVRNHSQGSDGSDGYRDQRWIQTGATGAPNNNVHPRGRRNGRALSNSSNRSRRSSDSTSGGRSGYSVFPPPSQATSAAAPILETSHHEQTADETLTEENATLTQDGCRVSVQTTPMVPRMYADAVKKKSSVASNASLDLVNGNVCKNGSSSSSQAPPPLTSPSVPAPPIERSYRNIAANLIAKPSPIVLAPPPPPPPPSSQSQTVRKENECRFDTKTAGIAGTSEIGHHQPQLVPPVNRLQR
ncbi:unnamed protein product [Caenorhabditis sp. 36 PRJEB53466]|nr:unnamed protein product [Caenorhabditis sp. 36 PRJEB53466]